MKRKRHTPEQIIRKLRTAEQLLNQGQTVADVCRILEVSAPTYHRWQQLYGGMKATEALAARLLRSSSGSRSLSRRTPGSNDYWLTLNWIRPCSSRRLLRRRSLLEEKQWELAEGNF
jgi:transposase-like protein